MNSNAHPLKVTLHSHSQSQVHKAVVVAAPSSTKEENFRLGNKFMQKYFIPSDANESRSENRSQDGFGGMTMEAITHSDVAHIHFPYSLSLFKWWRGKSIILKSENRLEI